MDPNFIQQTLDRVIPKVGMVTVVKLHDIKVGGLNAQSKFLIIPNPKDKNAQNILGSMTALGYDWAQTKMHRVQLRSNQMFVWYGDSYHAYEHVEEQLVKHFHIHEIKLRQEEFDALDESLPRSFSQKVTEPINKPTSGIKNNDFKEKAKLAGNTHGRTRALWKNHHEKFNSWETTFIKSIGQQLKENKKLTDRQAFYINKLFNKYKVGENETASSEGCCWEQMELI